MNRPIWFTNFLKGIYPSRHFLAKFTHIPLIGDLIDRIFFWGDKTYFLPMDQTIQVNAHLDYPESVVIPSQVVEHFVNQSNYHWIMDFCICREGDDCQDYPHSLGCLFLGEPVLKINPELGRLVSREEALEHLNRCQDAGLVHSIGSNRLDTIWLGASPVEELMTICSCCPCCCLWGLVTDLSPKISEKIIGLPGLQIKVTEDCNGCLLCLNGVCFVDAILIENGRAEVTSDCRGCGRCVEVCQEDAILITIGGHKNLEEVISHLSDVVELN